jgi:thiopurine S-methyltransferase
MDRDFWEGTWQRGQIGFHEGRPHGLLTRFADKLGEGRRVLVPLCGKSEDLAWLAAQGHEVLGIELVEDAVRAFFVEHQLTPTEGQLGPFKRFSAGALTLLAGDFFAATPALLGSFDALYDRAALVALPSEMRARYAQNIRDLLKPGAHGLVVTFEYPAGLLEGPPFSVPEAELRAHYAGADVELLAERSAPGERFAQLAQVVERCFHIAL